MSRATFESKMARESGITNKEAEAALNAFIDYIIETLKGGQRVALKGFGSFTVSEIKGHTGRNPKTGEAIQISPQKRVRFASSQRLKAALNS